MDPNPVFRNFRILIFTVSDSRMRFFFDRFSLLVQSSNWQIAHAWVGRVQPLNLEAIGDGSIWSIQLWTAIVEAARHMPDTVRRLYKVTTVTFTYIASLSCLESSTERAAISALGSWDSQTKSIGKCFRRVRVRHTHWQASVWVRMVHSPWAENFSFTFWESLCIHKKNAKITKIINHTVLGIHTLYLIIILWYFIPRMVMVW